MITIKVEGLVASRSLLDTIKQEAPVVLAQTLTFTAERVQASILDEIKLKIDRPTPTTLNSLKKTSATVRKLQAEVWFKDPFWTLAKNNASQHWMAPQVHGGDRPLKRFEASLQRVGIMPKGTHAVPGRGAKLDRYGNIPGGEIVRILSLLSAHRESGYIANVTARSRARNPRRRDYFATNGQGHGPHPLAAGIWEKLRGGGVKPIIMFVKESRYRPRVRFYEVGQASVDKHFNRILDQRLASALRKAK